jgi:hypothetical protein
MDEHAQIIQNQKAIAAALEFIIWRDHWKLNMSRSSYDMMNALRAVGGNPPLGGTPE